MSTGKPHRNPPQPLAERSAPSKRHPEALARCQIWKIRGASFWQCSKAARKGFPVCGVHGAGYALREKRGDAQNPKLSSLATGDYAQPETVGVLFASYPQLQQLYEHYVSDEVNLFDFRPHLAKALAIADTFLQTSDLKKSENASLAIDAIMRIGKFAGVVANLEQTMGPVTRAEMDIMSEAMAQTIAKFIPPERLEESRLFCRGLLLGGGRQVGAKSRDDARRV